MWWVARGGTPHPNMPRAPAHGAGPAGGRAMCVLIDERTMSDGETFAYGFRKLGLGPVVGRRSWGGQIWLTRGNRLADGGVASAGEIGVYTDEGWLIEGHGVEPDVEVSNPPVATFADEERDDQLNAAVQRVLARLPAAPAGAPRPPPAYPTAAEWSRPAAPPA